MSLTYVLDINGQPLMPTQRHGKVYRLLKSGRAKVVRREPFTIKLLYEPETYVVQDCTLGVDTGSKYIGAAVVSNNKVLYASEVKIKDDIKSKMDRRRAYRKNKRYRKTRYRKVRFLNRGNSNKKGRYSPTLVSKFNSHVREIEFIKSILPISKLVLEVGQFDTHLMKNPALANPKIKHWVYQKGENYGFANSREHALFRDKYTCQVCKAKNTRLEVHHIKYRSQGGTDDLNNLIILCEECHKKVHAEKISINKKVKKLPNFKSATTMSILRSMLLKTYPNAIETFGYVTRENRLKLGLPKEHFVDACVIASGGDKFILPNSFFAKRHVTRGDYQLSKGSRSEKRIPQTKIQGFRKWDKVKYMGGIHFIKGRCSVGTCFLEDIYGNKIDFSYMPRGFKTPKLSNCKRISARKTTLCQRTEYIQKVN